MNPEELVSLLARIFELPEKSNVIFENILTRVDDENRITLNIKVKNEIRDITSKETQTIEKYILLLNDRGLLRRGERGQYKLSSKLFTKCWNKVDRDLGMQLRVNKVNDKIVVRCEEEEV